MFFLEISTTIFPIIILKETCLNQMQDQRWQNYTPLSYFPPQDHDMKINDPTRILLIVNWHCNKICNSMKMCQIWKPLLKKAAE